MHKAKGQDTNIIHTAFRSGWFLNSILPRFFFCLSFRKEDDQELPPFVQWMGLVQISVGKAVAFIVRDTYK